MSVTLITKREPWTYCNILPTLRVRFLLARRIVGLVLDIGLPERIMERFVLVLFTCRRGLRLGNI